jgi:hypothetical protein
MFVTLYRDDQAELRWLLRAIRRIGCPKSAPAALTEPVTIIGQPPNAVMSALGQKRTYALQKGMSALPLIATVKADIALKDAYSSRGVRS